MQYTRDTGTKQAVELAPSGALIHATREIVNMRSVARNYRGRTMADTHEKTDTIGLLA